mgnify:CR=1 FL=1
MGKKGVLQVSWICIPFSTCKTSSYPKLARAYTRSRGLAFAGCYVKRVCDNKNEKLHYRGEEGGGCGQRLTGRGGQTGAHGVICAGCGWCQRAAHTSETGDGLRKVGAAHLRRTVLRTHGRERAVSQV